MTAPIAIHKPNRTQVSTGRLIVKQRQQAADTSGKTGTHGVRNGRGRSGSRRRNTLIPTATRTNANRVPMFVSSSTQPIGANAADTATNTPVMIVVMCGVLYLGCTRAAHGGSSPSRAMDMKMRAWPSWNTRSTDVIAATAPSARIPAAQSAWMYCSATADRQSAVEGPRRRRCGRQMSCIGDWSSDVCSSDLGDVRGLVPRVHAGGPWWQQSVARHGHEDARLAELEYEEHRRHRRNRAERKNPRRPIGVDVLQRDRRSAERRGGATEETVRAADELHR